MGNRKAQFKNIDVNIAVISVIIVILLLEFFAAAIPIAQGSGNSINESGVPLGSFFAQDGLVFLVIMAALLILLIKNLLKREK